MNERDYRIYTGIVYTSALMIGAAFLLWEPVDPSHAATALGFLILHMVAAVRDYRRGLLLGW